MLIPTALARNELEILLPTLQASLAFSLHLQLAARNSGKEH